MPHREWLLDGKWQSGLTVEQQLFAKRERYAFTQEECDAMMKIIKAMDRDELQGSVSKIWRRPNLHRMARTTAN